MHDGIKTIFFDVGNTLLFPNRDVILAALAEQSAPPTLEQWRALERETKRGFDAVVKSDGTHDHSFWFSFYTSLLEQFESKDEALLDALLLATRTSANWCEIRPGTREALERIGQRYRTAVISNADGKIHQVLGRCGIHDCFESITDSGVVGYEKPHPAIFQAALDAMKASPEESLYVGDVYSVDYVGARGAGMHAMLFDVCGAYRDAGVPRVESLEELEEKLMG